MPGITDILGGSLLGGIKGIIGEFKLSPDKKAELQAAVDANAELLAQKQLEYDARMVEAVNATMQAEAKSEHWAQWLWRPVVGFTFAAVILNNYALLPYFARVGLQPIAIPSDVWQAIMVVLGAAAAGRSVEKAISAYQAGK